MPTRQEIDDALQTTRDNIKTSQGLFLADKGKYAKDKESYAHLGIIVNETFQPKNGNPAVVSYLLKCEAVEGETTYTRTIIEEPTFSDTGWIKNT